MANRKISAELELKGKDSSGPAFRSVAARMGQIERQMATFNKTSANFTRQVQAIERASAAGTGRMAQVHAGMEKTAALVRGGLAGAGALAIGAGIKGAVEDFAALERRMTRIGLTAGVAQEEIDGALQGMKQQSKALALPLDDAVSAMEEMTSAGMEFKEAYAFLPSVLATTQATGAAARDVAATTVQAANTLKISSGQMQHAFDLINEGGKAGSFEAKDMATYLPMLANGFAAIGYTGTSAIAKISAYMQTLRAHTSDASTAANQMENILSKMNSEETINRFKKFGIDLDKEMKKRIKAGQGRLEAFLEVSRLALNGNMDLIPQLYGDTQVQNGMRSLLIDVETYRRVIDVLNSSRVDGSVQRDNQVILGQTKASIDRLAESMAQLKTGVGSAVAPVIQPGIDSAVQALDLYNARQRGMEKRGWSYWQRQFGILTGNDELDLAYEGGYSDPAFLADYWANRYSRPATDKTRPRTSTGRHNRPVVLPEFPGGGHGYTAGNMPTSGAPIPSGRPEASASSPVSRAMADLAAQYKLYGEGKRFVDNHATPVDTLGFNMDFDKRVVQSMQQGGEQAGDALREGGSQAGDALREGAAVLLGAISSLKAAIADMRSASGGGRPGVPPQRPVNADTGRSMPPSTYVPPGGR